eukprot:3398972-Rhodomonas_salina.1
MVVSDLNAKCLCPIRLAGTPALCDPSQAQDCRGGHCRPSAVWTKCEQCSPTVEPALGGADPDDGGRRGGWPLVLLPWSGKPTPRARLPSRKHHHGVSDGSRAQVPVTVLGPART